MANISTEIAKISTATYGEQVRTAICDALRKMNAEGLFGGGSMISGEVIIFGFGVELPIITGNVVQEREE